MYNSNGREHQMRGRFSDVERHDEWYAAACGYEAVACDACCEGMICREVCGFKPDFVLIEEGRVTFYKEYYDYLGGFYGEAD